MALERLVAQSTPCIIFADFCVNNNDNDDRTDCFTPCDCTHDNLCIIT